MGMECEIFMGKEDTDRQALNVFRMELLKVHAVTSGTQTLKRCGKRNHAGSGAAAWTIPLMSWALSWGRILFR